MSYPTHYPELNALLAQLLHQTQSILLENFVGLYLTGSFARGGFDRDSDVDFLTVTRVDPTPEQEAALQAMHGQIYEFETPWAKHLEGSYIPASLLERPDPARTELLFLNNTARELVRSDHSNTLVVRWTMREYGVALAGPDPKTLVQPVVSDELRQEVARVMERWAAEMDAQPEVLENRWYQPYAVVQFCRMLYTLEMGTVISKPDGVRWGKENLDSRYGGLIERAWLERPDPSLKSQQQADPQDARETLEFVRYALEVKDEFMVKRQS